jgi:hypothetical protein
MLGGKVRPMTDDERLKLYRIARMVRRFLETRWLEKQSVPFTSGIIGYIPSRGMCVDTAGFLTPILREWHHPQWNCMSGSYINRQGTPMSHCWSSNADLDVILDLTADQFNDAAIVITSLSDRRYPLLKAGVYPTPERFFNPYRRDWDEHIKTHEWPPQN